MSDSPVCEPVDDESLRELVRGLMEKVRELEARMALVEMRPTGWPSYPVPSTVTWPSACSVCGLKWDGPMGYCCPRADCPSSVRCLPTLTYTAVGTV